MSARIGTRHSALTLATMLIATATTAFAQSPAADPDHSADHAPAASRAPVAEKPSGMSKGMMGQDRGGMMGGCMMGHGMMAHGAMGQPLAMRFIFALMDSDGDGTVTLGEFQAADERIFKAMDANKDGVLTLEEIQAFMRGTSKPAAPSRETNK